MFELDPMTGILGNLGAVPIRKTTSLFCESVTDAAAGDP
jgi:hypothetical protein